MARIEVVTEPSIHSLLAAPTLFFFAADLSKAKSFNDFKFVPKIIDQFPQQNYNDSPLPEHVAQFIYPDGCCPSVRERPPMFYTFVLTSETGSKVYGASMQVWETVMRM